MKANFQLTPPSYLANMIRTSLLRLTPASYIARSRPYTTTPPPTSKPKQGSDNTLLYLALGVGAAGGAYYYLKDSGEAQDLKDKAKKDEEIVKHKGQEAIDAAKARADDAYRQGQVKLENTKQEGKELLDKGIHATEARGRSIGEDLEAKFDSAKNTTISGLTRARDSTEHLYSEARSSAEAKAREAREEAEKKAQEAKASWSSWFGWGSSKAKEEANKAEAEADRLKREAAQKTADVADDTKQRAQKHA
ncbi:hypothetical protein CVT26_006212 [Gymnopilus dilepis]|uniref:Uncharacterized protein n=1 Tax=Gymnopilus dilepis TaxID=231916 RepID=A0A409Y1F3_9AGAR|nr:hypothetical protein CVT26_006212 [Gymnopilus dilepis]